VAPLLILSIKNMNRKLLFPFFAIALTGVVWIWFAMDGNKPDMDAGVINNKLPWQINIENEKTLQVFSLHVGQDSLSAVVKKLRKLPELALFEDAEGVRQIEAYFSRVKLAMLEGRMVAEVDVEGVDLSGFARFAKKGQPTPSGRRKYKLSKTGIIKANALRVWKLVYMPRADYTEAQLLRFFGEPGHKKTVSAGVENWYYPNKGLLITYDKDGRELFYYAAVAEYGKMLKGVEKDISSMQNMQGDAQ